MRRRDVDRALRELAERQHGVVSRSQARRVAADRAALRRRTASGEWEAATSQVLRLVAAQSSFQQRCIVAALHAAREQWYLTRRPPPCGELRAVAIELLEHGRTGSALMRRLLADRGAGYIPPASGLEARFFALLVEAGLGLPDRQVDLGGQSWAGRVDYLYRHLKDGRRGRQRAPSHQQARRRSRRPKRREPTGGGLDVLRVTGEQVWERPHDVVALIRSALHQAA